MPAAGLRQYDHFDGALFRLQLPESSAPVFADQERAAKLNKLGNALPVMERFAKT